MIVRSRWNLLMGAALLVSCTSTSTYVEPTATNDAGQWLMVKNDCDGDCEDSPLGFDGTYYLPSCVVIDEPMLGEAVAVKDPESPLPVPYEEARSIVGTDRKVAVAMGLAAHEPWCEANCGWWIAISTDHLYDTTPEGIIASAHAAGS